MKKYLILLMMSVLFACNSQAGYVLKGVFKGAGDGCAVLRMHSKGKLVICDTVKMKGGKFVFEGETPCVGFALVTVVPEGKESVQMRLALENSKIEMKGDWKNVGMDEEGELVVKGMTVTGSKNNDVNEEIGKQWKVVETLPGFTKYAELAKKVQDNPEILEDTTFYWVYRKEFDAYMARVKEEQMKIIVANPSVETAAYQLYFMMNEMPNSDAICSVFWGDVISAVTGLPFLLGETQFPPSALVSLVILGVFQVGVAYVCLCIGLKTTPPVTASLVSGIEPVLNPILVAVFYGEKMGKFALVGAAIVIGGVVGYNVLRVKKPESATKQ